MKPTNSNETIAFNANVKYVGGIKIAKRKTFPNAFISHYKDKLNMAMKEANHFETDYSKTQWKNAQLLGDYKGK